MSSCLRDGLARHEAVFNNQQKRLFSRFGIELCMRFLVTKNRYAFMALALSAIVTSSAFAGDIVFAPVLSVQSRYDNNITSRSAEVNRIEDYVTRITPYLDFAHSTKTSRSSLVYRPTAQIYAKNPDMNTVSHALLAEMVAEPMPRMRFTLGDTYNSSKESREASMSGVQTSRDSVWSNAVKASARYHAKPSLSFGLRASDYIVKFASPSSVDTKTDTAGADAVYAVSNKLSLNGSYTFSNFIFSSETSPEESSQTHSVLAGADWMPMEGLAVKLAGGMFFSPESQAGDDWRAEASIAKTFSRGLAAIEYSRSVDTTPGLTDRLAVFDNLRFKMKYSLDRAVDIGLVNSYYRYDISDAEVRNVSSLETGVELNWKANKWLSIGTGYVHFQQWYKGTATEDVNILRDYIMVNFTATPLPYRF